MTQASFYKNERPGAVASTGIYFEVPEDQLAKELQRRKKE